MNYRRLSVLRGGGGATLCYALRHAKAFLSLTLEVTRCRHFEEVELHKVERWLKPSLHRRRVAFIERSLSDQSSQRSFKKHPAIAKISQWSVYSKFCLCPKQSLIYRQGKRSLNKCSTKTQQTLNKCSSSALQSHRSPNDLSVIFLWTPTFSTLKERWLIDLMSTQGSHRNHIFLLAFVRSLRDQANFWSPKDLCPV